MRNISANFRSRAVLFSTFLDRANGGKMAHLFSRIYPWRRNCRASRAESLRLRVRWAEQAVHRYGTPPGASF